MPKSKEEKVLTFGERAVGLSFNPGKFPEVEEVKKTIAKLIDDHNNARNNTTNPEEARLHSVAITELQTAQMWSVKAITWGK